MKVFDVEVIQIVRVTLDETKFGDDFMQEFRESICNFRSLGEHAEHLGQLYARGVADDIFPGQSFIEGYGEASEMGIRFKDLGVEASIIKETDK